MNEPRESRRAGAATPKKRAGAKSFSAKIGRGAGKKRRGKNAKFYGVEKTQNLAARFGAVGARARGQKRGGKNAKLLARGQIRKRGFLGLCIRVFVLNITFLQ